MQNFRLSSAQVKFHQICTLTGSFQLNKNRGIMSYDTDEWCKMWRKPIYCFKNDKNLVNFDPSNQKSQKFAFLLVPFVESVFHTEDYLHTSYRRVILHDIEEFLKKKLKKNWFVPWKIIWEVRVSFSEGTPKSQNWDFWWDPFVQSRKWMS